MPRRFLTVAATCVPAGEAGSSPAILLTATSRDGTGWWAWVVEGDPIESATWSPLPAIPAEGEAQ